MARPITRIFGGCFQPLDSRVADVRYINYAYAAPRVTTRCEWEDHAEKVRRRVMTSAGLCPMPDRTPLNARVYDQSELDGCSIEKVRFESRPGFLVTGNLYRPLNCRKKHPAVLCAHGHAPKGRMENDELHAYRQMCMMEKPLSRPPPEYLKQPHGRLTHIGLSRM